jgi:hypothetical protein
VCHLEAVCAVIDMISNQNLLSKVPFRPRVDGEVWRSGDIFCGMW